MDVKGTRKRTYLVMGVSGCGKSTVGLGLARRLGGDFLDADDYHPDANLAKMKAGIALADDDRWPWLERLNTELLNRQNDPDRGATVLACSALKDVYRQRLLKGIGCHLIIYLDGSFESILARVQSRSNHFMPSSLLATQFADLEEPKGALRVSVDLTVEEQLDTIMITI